jgi:hypothetical protein
MTDLDRRRKTTLGLLAKYADSAVALEGVAFEVLPHADDVGQHVSDVMRRMPADEVGDPGDFARALDLVLKHSTAALQELASNPGAALSHDHVSALEAVVRADGSRPSLLLRSGRADPDHPLAGDWHDSLVATADLVAQRAASIGRVEPDNGSGNNFFGTATVVDSAKGLALTNWHVVEAVCRRPTTLFEAEGAGRYRFYGGAYVDFAAETGAAVPKRFRVVEAEVSGVDGAAFERLDAAVLHLEPLDGNAMPQAVSLTTDPDGPGGTFESLCLIGHPGRPAQGSGVENVGGKSIDWGWVNATLFGNRFGLKRISPGLVDAGLGKVSGDPRRWIFGHDATSLGGSSGASVIAWKNGGEMFGLHFAGATLRSNYAHAIGPIADRLSRMGVPLSPPADVAQEPVARDIAADGHGDETAPRSESALAVEGGAADTWRVANALLCLRDQVNIKAPNRSKASDGTIGDAAHARRSSDHNPHVRDGAIGVVTAMDITHDPAHGCDAGRLADALIASRDPRIKYVIWNRRIASATVSPWIWRPYSGANPHDKHVHVSVVAEKSLYDDIETWQI